MACPWAKGGQETTLSGHPQEAVENDSSCSVKVLETPRWPWQATQQDTVCYCRCQLPGRASNWKGWHYNTGFPTTTNTILKLTFFVRLHKQLNSCFASTPTQTDTGWFIGWPSNFPKAFAAPFARVITYKTCSHSGPEVCSLGKCPR